MKALNLLLTFFAFSPIVVLGQNDGLKLPSSKNYFSAGIHTGVVLEPVTKSGVIGFSLDYTWRLKGAAYWGFSVNGFYPGKEVRHLTAMGDARDLTSRFQMMSFNFIQRYYIPTLSKGLPFFDIELGLRKAKSEGEVKYDAMLAGQPHSGTYEAYSVKDKGVSFGIGLGWHFEPLAKKLGRPVPYFRLGFASGSSFEAVKADSLHYDYLGNEIYSTEKVRTKFLTLVLGMRI